MDERILKAERTKMEKLLDTAQQNLDSAKSAKAPSSTIKFLEQRVEALEGRIKKIDSFNAPKSQDESSAGEQMNATKPKVVKNKGNKDNKEV
jgi:cob(I)alamin adenosyltransferase